MYLKKLSSNSGRDARTSEMMITSRPTNRAVSVDIPSKYTNLAPSNADNNIDWDKSSGTKGGSPGV